MTTADEVKQAVLSLSEPEYAKIIDWLHELAEEAWDREIEADSKAGRLDFLAAEALEAKRQGTLRVMPSQEEWVVCDLSPGNAAPATTRSRPGLAGSRRSW